VHTASSHFYGGVSHLRSGNTIMVHNMRLRLTTSLIKLAEIFIEKLLIVFKQ